MPSPTLIALVCSNKSSASDDVVTVRQKDHLERMKKQTLERTRCDGMGELHDRKERVGKTATALKLMCKEDQLEGSEEDAGQGARAAGRPTSISSQVLQAAGAETDSDFH